MIRPLCQRLGQKNSGGPRGEDSAAAPLRTAICLLCQGESSSGCKLCREGMGVGKGMVLAWGHLVSLGVILGNCDMIYQWLSGI